MDREVVSGALPIVSELSEAFRQIADAIDANEERPFGGAFVIIAPAAEGDEPEILSGLHIERNQNAANFWGFLKGKVDIKIMEMQEQERRGLVRR